MPFLTKPEDKQFVVNSRASLHKLNRKDLNSAELNTFRASRTLATVITANGEVQTNWEATVHVHDLDLFMTSVSPHVLFTCTIALVTRHTMRDWSVRSFISMARVIRWCARHRQHPHNAFPFHFYCCHSPHQVQVCYATIWLKPCEDSRQDKEFPNLHTSAGFEPKKIELYKNLWPLRKIRWLTTTTWRKLEWKILL